MRVFDYGEPGNDWLSIDKRRLSRSGGSISNSLLLGSVMLDRISSYGLREKQIEKDSSKMKLILLSWMLYLT